MPEAWVALVGVTVWWTLGFNAVIFLAGLQDIPASSTRPPGSTARTRGTGSGTSRCRGCGRSWPFVTMVTIIASANIFGQSYLMTNGAPGTETRTAIYYIADTGLQNYQMGAAAAMSYDPHAPLMLSARSSSSVRPDGRGTRTAPDASTGDRRNGGRRRRAPALLVLIVLTLLFVSPLLFMLLTSFKTRVGVHAVPPTLVPQEPTSQAYADILNAAAPRCSAGSSTRMFAATANSALVVATAALAAYPLARMEFRGKRSSSPPSSRRSSCPR